MDYGNDSEMWDWPRENHCLQKEATPVMPWLGVSQNEEDLSYMFDETTPVKACGDLAYQVTDSANMNKELQHARETSSHLKRRRMLQFDDEVLDSHLCNEEMPSVFLKSKDRDSLEEAFSDMSEWVSGFAEDSSASCYEGLDQSSEGWLADCINDAEMHCSIDETCPSGASNVIEISEFGNNPPGREVTLAEENHARVHRNVIFKGRKSYMRTSTKLASSVVYPFAFIKPCGAHGDVTLKDINQRIRTPPPSKLKQSIENPSAPYPTSALTGKPVVGKTKIRTEGGKGSITIMRTKG